MIDSGLSRPRAGVDRAPNGQKLDYLLISLGRFRIFLNFFRIKRNPQRRGLFTPINLFASAATSIHPSVRPSEATAGDGTSEEETDALDRPTDRPTNRLADLSPVPSLDRESLIWCQEADLSIRPDLHSFRNAIHFRDAPAFFGEE